MQLNFSESPSFSILYVIISAISSVIVLSIAAFFIYWFNLRKKSCGNRTQVTESVYNEPYESSNHCAKPEPVPKQNGNANVFACSCVRAQRETEGDDDLTYEQLYVSKEELEMNLLKEDAEIYENISISMDNLSYLKIASTPK